MLVLLRLGLEARSSEWRVRCPSFGCSVHVAERSAAQTGRPGFGARTHGRPRARLRELLLDTLPQGTVSWNARAVGFEQEGERVVTLRLEDGSSRTGDVLVACDGARSAARLQVFGERLRYVGLSRIGGLADRFEHPRLEHGPFMTLGTAMSAFVHPLAHEQLVWSVALRTAEDELAGLSPAELLESRRDGDEGLARADPDSRRVDEGGRRRPASAVRRRATGSGAAGTDPAARRRLACDDAVPRPWGEHGDGRRARTRRGSGRSGSVVQALRLFESRMLPRNRRAVNASHRASQSLHPASTFGAIVRNARLTAGRFRRA